MGAPEANLLALGDSYTICTGASGERTSWPSLVAERLAAALGAPVRVTNLGVNGFTTADLVRHELPHLGDRAWDFITVLIGVNDWVQGVPEAEYRARLRGIYAALSALGLSAGRVAAVSIPDFSYTPAAASFGGAATINAGLRRFNAVAAEEAAGAGFPLVDVFDVSRAGAGSPGWISDDDLHPGDAQYAAWAAAIWAALAPAWSGL